MHIPYAKHTISEDEIKAVSAVLRSDQIARGEVTKEFEKMFAKMCDATYCVVFSSASCALMASFEAIGIDRFCTLLTTSITYVATVSYALQKGAKLQLVDCLPNGCMDLEKAKEQCQNLRGRTIFVPMHYAGSVLNMEDFLQGLSRPVEVIEDACHAVGARYKDQKCVGSNCYSEMTVFSFHPSKVMTTGEGGCVTTNDFNLYKKLLSFRNNGIEAIDSFEYDCVDLSSNYHMTDFQAVLGIAQLKKLEHFLQNRFKVVKWYYKYLKDTPCLTLLDLNTTKDQGYHLFVVRIAFAKLSIDKKTLQQKLLEKGIQVQVHYKPLHHLSAIKKHLYFSELELNEAELFYHETLTLPLFPSLSEKQVIKISQTLGTLIKQHIKAPIKT
jgi:dTDP-4-amino-4,6-dideoxygalactose transaminase